MGTRSFAQVAPTDATMALNAYIFGYAGHSLVTPHAQLKQLWWTDERIEAKVTRSFVVSKLRGEEREFLNRQVGFGEGLTDDTYIEWILEKAKRLFLILADVGIPDQIFGCIDDSYDDRDLPIPLIDVQSLDLAPDNDDALNRKFYDTQFLFLLRELTRGSHIDYGPREHIPMEYVNTLPPATCLQVWDRIHFPGKPDEIFMRRRYALTDKESGYDHRPNITRDVRKAQAYAHAHIASVWASYTSDSAAYVMSDFVGEHTLETFINHRLPPQLQRLSPADRSIMLCEWMHCLADALASLHHRCVAHTAIRPSNILIDHDNKIVFADVGSLRTFQRGKRVNKTEVYNYAAPESRICQLPALTAPSSPPISSMSAFSKLRKMSSSGSSSSTSSSSAANSVRNSSVSTLATSPATPHSPGRSNKIATLTATMSPLSSPSKSSSGFRNFSRHLIHPSIASSSTDEPPSPKTTFYRVSSQSTLPRTDSLQDVPTAAASPEMSDIYSLGCIFLDILTFLLKGKNTEFLKFRTSPVASPPNNNTTSHNHKRGRADVSFHANPDRITAWTKVLLDDAERRGEHIFCGVPALLDLVQDMMSRAPTARPTATAIRDRIHEILVHECGVARKL